MLLSNIFSSVYMIFNFGIEYKYKCRLLGGSLMSFSELDYENMFCLCLATCDGYVAERDHNRRADMAKPLLLN